MEYPIKTILYATDLGPHGPSIFNHAAGMAQAFGAKIHIIHAVEPLTDYGHSLVEAYLPDTVVDSLKKEGYQEAIKEMQRRLEAFCKDKLHEGADKLVASMRVVEGFPAQTILSEAKRLNADLIVLGTHGLSALGEMLMGSVAHKVAMKSSIPVLLIPIHRDHSKG